MSLVILFHFIKFVLLSYVPSLLIEIGVTSDPSVFLIIFFTSAVFPFAITSFKFIF